MNIRFVLSFDFRVKDDDIKISGIIDHFNFIISKVDDFTQTKKNWYETGYSRKQALKKIAFHCGDITEAMRAKWERSYEKNKPLFIDGVWDANDDDCSCSISYRKMFHNEKNRVSVEINLVAEKIEETLHKFIILISQISSCFDCSYASVDSKGYAVLGRNVFPDRLSVGWMLYVPYIVMSDLIKEAAEVVPVMKGNKQTGTIIVSTNEIFDGDKEKYIGRANDVEIKLLDLGFLPLMTEL